MARPSELIAAVLWLSGIVASLGYPKRLARGWYRWHVRMAAKRGDDAAAARLRFAAQSALILGGAVAGPGSILAPTILGGSVESKLPLGIALGLISGFIRFIAIVARSR